MRCADNRLPSQSACRFPGNNNCSHSADSPRVETSQAEKHRRGDWLSLSLSLCCVDTQTHTCSEKRKFISDTAKSRFRSGGHVCSSVCAQIEEETWRDFPSVHMKVVSYVHADIQNESVFSFAPVITLRRRLNVQWGTFNRLENSFNLIVIPLSDLQKQTTPSASRLFLNISKLSLTAGGKTLLAFQNRADWLEVVWLRFHSAMSGPAQSSHWIHTLHIQNYCIRFLSMQFVNFDFVVLFRTCPHRLHVCPSWERDPEVSSIFFPLAFLFLSIASFSSLEQSLYRL